MIYKIKHKQDVVRYDVGDTVFCDDIYLLDYLEGFSVICRRDSSGRLVHGSRFCELLDMKERSDFREYLYDERQDPLLLCTEVGTAIVNKYLTPSTLMVLVCFLEKEKRNGDLAKLAAGAGIDGLEIPSLYERGEERIVGARALLSDLRDVLQRLKLCLEEPFIPEGVQPRRTVQSFKDMVYRLSMLGGCSVELVCDKEIVCERSFDVCAFKGFLLSMLMLARRKSLSRGLRLEISSSSEGISARVIFETGEKARALSYPEVALFYDMAERNNMLFEASSDGGVLNVRFCPTRKDWSLLELKASVDFDWNS